MAKKNKKKKETEDMIKIQGEDEVRTEEKAEEKQQEEIKEEETNAEEQEAKEAAEAETGDEDAPVAEEAEDEEGSGEEAAAEEVQDDEAEAGSSKKAKKASRKKDKKDELIEDLQDKLTRRMAEFDNFRKRTEKEKSQMYSMGARDVLEKMLEVLDNFERGFDAVDEENQDDAFVQGMQMVYKQMQEALEKLGVKPIEAVGQPFDPNFHNAVMHEDNEEAGENEVVAEFQKGYMYHDDVIRHSMVKVAN